MFLPLRNAEGGAVVVNTNTIATLRPLRDGALTVGLVDGSRHTFNAGQAERLLDAAGVSANGDGKSGQRIQEHGDEQNGE